MIDRVKPTYDDRRAARAFANKLHPRRFNGGDELYPPTEDIPYTQLSEQNKSELEKEAWYQEWKKRKAQAR